MDAVRTSDNTLVYIKHVPTDSDELKIALLLSATAVRDDPHNHCVPVLDHFEDETDRSMTFMVMPFLLSIDAPPFETVGQVVDFVTQMLEVGGQSMNHEASG